MLPLPCAIIQGHKYLTECLISYSAKRDIREKKIAAVVLSEFSEKEGNLYLADLNKPEVKKALGIFKLVASNNHDSSRAGSSELERDQPDLKSPGSLQTHGTFRSSNVYATSDNRYGPYADGYRFPPDNSNGQPPAESDAEETTLSTT